MPPSFRKILAPPVSQVVKQCTDSIHNGLHKHEPSLEDHNYQPITKTDVDEIWFAGAHCGMSITLRKIIGSVLKRLTDIGGGSVKNGTRNSLARIPLRWMVRQCFLAKTGIIFYRSMFKQIGMDEAALYPNVLDRPPPVYQTLPAPSLKGYSMPKPHVVHDPTVVPRAFVSEEQEDLADATCLLHDQLKIAPGWWILEVIPQMLNYQRDEDNSWDKGIV